MGAGRKTSTYDVDTRAGEVRSFEDLQRNLTQELGGCIFGACPEVSSLSMCCEQPLIQPQSLRVTGWSFREAPARPFACRTSALSVSHVKEA